MSVIQVIIALAVAAAGGGGIAVAIVNNKAKKWEWQKNREAQKEDRAEEKADQTKSIVDENQRQEERLDRLDKQLETIVQGQRAIMDGLSQKIDEMDDRLAKVAGEVDSLRNNNDERYAITCRVRILRFGDECRLHQKHSLEAFTQVLEDIDKYEEYCNQHPMFKNRRTVAAEEIIQSAYHHCMDENDFL